MKRTGHGILPTFLGSEVGGQEKNKANNWSEGGRGFPMIARREFKI